MMMVTESIADPDRGSPAPVSVLSVRGVVKEFTNVRAVDGLSFRVNEGEVLGFLGPNGAGKTTTLRMIMGITRPDTGEVRFRGAPRIDPRRVGYLPEERGLLPDARVEEMLRYLGELRGLISSEAARAAGKWIDRLGLGQDRTRKIGELSKGNQQKVQFAGAVLHAPDLVVLDEPFSGLDPLHQEMVLGEIDTLRARGAAVLLSAHQLDLVERLCDRFHLIARGRCVLEGTIESIRHRMAEGATDVLTVVGRARARSGPEAESIAYDLRESVRGADHRLRFEGDGRVRIELTVTEGTDLHPILESLGRFITMERLDTRPLSLHEIYIRAVRAATEAPGRQNEGLLDAT